MKDTAQTILEWTYTPTDFFEASIKIVLDTGVIDVEEGKARGTFLTTEYERGAEFRDQMHERLRQDFAVQQLFSQQPFKLSKASMSREHQDGRRDVTIFAETGHLNIQTFPADILLTDAEGNVIKNSRQERLTRQGSFREQVSQYAPDHPELMRMLDSYRMSLEDESNCFMHLHEITDILAKSFGGTNAARATFGEKAWRTLGELANNDPNTASRHRGRHAHLESVSHEKLNVGRSSARQLIEAYLCYLEGS